MSWSRLDHSIDPRKGPVQTGGRLVEKQDGRKKGVKLGRVLHVQLEATERSVQGPSGSR